MLRETEQSEDQASLPASQLERVQQSPPSKGESEHLRSSVCQYAPHDIPLIRGNNYILTGDDANALSMSVGEIVDDQGRKVYYDYDSNYPILLDSKFNETFDINGTLMSYCETDYTYDTPTNDPNHSHYWPKSLKTTWNSQDGRNNWTRSTLAENDYTLDAAGQRLTNSITDNTGFTNKIPSRHGHGLWLITESGAWSSRSHP